MVIFWRRNYYRWYTKLIHYENYDALLHVNRKGQDPYIHWPNDWSVCYWLSLDPICSSGQPCIMTSQSVIIPWHFSMIFNETWDEKLAWNSIIQFISLLLLILWLQLLNVKIRSSHLNTCIVCIIVMGLYLRARAICLALPHHIMTMIAKGVAHLRQTNYKGCIKIF